MNPFLFHEDDYVGLTYSLVPQQTCDSQLSHLSTIHLSFTSSLVLHIPGLIQVTSLHTEENVESVLSVLLLANQLPEFHSRTHEHVLNPVHFHIFPILLNIVTEYFVCIHIMACTEWLHLMFKLQL